MLLPRSAEYRATNHIEFLKLRLKTAGDVVIKKTFDLEGATLLSAVTNAEIYYT